nr:insulin-like growth factor-binding protein-like 1 [Odocoileus virginianus texanus]
MPSPPPLPIYPRYGIYKVEGRQRGKRALQQEAGWTHRWAGTSEAQEGAVDQTSGRAAHSHRRPTMRREGDLAWNAHPKDALSSAPGSALLSLILTPSDTPGLLFTVLPGSTCWFFKTQMGAERPWASSRPYGISKSPLVAEGRIYSVCGSDGRSYPSVCALRLRARQAPRALPGHLHKARDGPCEFAPVVITPPQSVHNVTGAQVYLSCEVRAVPTPVVTWRKVTRSPAGTQATEDLPGDHVNIAVHVRGGPSDHEATAWVLINPLRKEDEGLYQCHSANALGEAQSHGTVTVVDRSQHRAPRFPAPDDRL